MPLKYFTDRGFDITGGDYHLLEQEDYEQRAKWGLQTHTIFQWLAFTTEELGELSQAISDYTFRDGQLQNIVEEATQLATLALKIAVMAKAQL